MQIFSLGVGFFKYNFHSADIFILLVVDLLKYVYMCLDFHIQAKINNDDDSMVPTGEWHESSKSAYSTLRKKERKKKDSLRVLFFRFHEAMRNINEIPFEFYTCLASRHQDVSFTSSRVQHEWFSLKWPIWKFYLWSSLDSPECWAYRLIFFLSFPVLCYSILEYF